ncbi:MAG: hypothetical protein ACFFD4_38070 [Candidatus Odinarchaeota archaeon]
MEEKIVDEIIDGYEQLVLNTIARKGSNRQETVENAVHGFIDDIHHKLAVTAVTSERKQWLAEKLVTFTNELLFSSTKTWERGKNFIRTIFRVYLVSYLLSCYNSERISGSTITLIH